MAHQMTEKRKAQRQLERKLKKQRKQVYFSKKKQVKEMPDKATRPSVRNDILMDDPFHAVDDDAVEACNAPEIVQLPVVHKEDEEMAYYAKKLKFKGKMPKWEEWDDFQDLLQMNEEELSSDTELDEASMTCDMDVEKDSLEDAAEQESQVQEIEEEKPMEGTTTTTANDHHTLSSEHVKQITRWLNRLSLKTFNVVSDEISAIMSVTGTNAVAEYLVNVINNCTIEGVLWFNCALISQLSFKDAKGPLFATQIIAKCIDLLFPTTLKKRLFTCLCIFVHCKLIPTGFIVSILQYFCNLSEFDTVLDLSSIATELLGEQLRKECRIQLSTIIDTLKLHTTTWTGSRNDFLFSKCSALLHSKYDVRKYESIPFVWSDIQKTLLNKRNVLLSITLQDMTTIQENGMWWIQGTRFNGYSSEQIAQRKSQLQQKDRTLQLASQMGMNTAVRKEIFTIIMNSQDYKDASQKLVHLKLKKTNEREIINVICQLIKGLKKQNPFYMLLLEEVCNKIPSLEYSLRKRIYQILVEDLSELELGNCVDLMTFCVQHKLMHFSSILKGADFEIKTTLLLLKELMNTIKNKHPVSWTQIIEQLDSGLLIKLKSHELLEQ